MGLSANMDKKKCLFLHKEFPEDYKNHRTFVTSAFWGLVMAAEPWEHFFWTPCRFISDLNSQTGPQESQYKDKRMVV